LAFQIQWQENEGQENEAGEYQVLQPTAVSKKTCFSVCPNVSLGAKGDYDKLTVWKGNQGVSQARLVAFGFQHSSQCRL
jgi:hypothetical protein